MQIPSQIVQKPRTYLDMYLTDDVSELVYLSQSKKVAESEWI